MGKKTIPVLLVILLLTGCYGGESASDVQDVDGVDAPADIIPGEDGSDQAVDVPGELAPDKIPFTGSGCSEGLASAVVEVQLSTMEVRRHVTVSPPAAAPLSDEEMIAAGEGILAARVPTFPELAGCPAGFSDFGVLDYLFYDCGDFSAGFLFHRTAAKTALAWAGEWFSYSGRIEPPDPLEDAEAGIYQPAAEPYPTYYENSSDNASVEELDSYIQPLNNWGQTWATVAGSSWTDRSFQEIWDLVLGSDVFNGFAACGPYEAFVIGLGPTGGSYAGDVGLIRVLFILTGSVDQSLVD
jgi:hypothetical protein